MKKYILTIFTLGMAQYGESHASLNIEREKTISSPRRFIREAPSIQTTNSENETKDQRFHRLYPGLTKKEISKETMERIKNRKYFPAGDYSHIILKMRKEGRLKIYQNNKILGKR